MRAIVVDDKAVVLTKDFFFSSRRHHTRYWRDWSSDVCSSDLPEERIAVVTSVPAVFWVAISQAGFADVDVSGVRFTTYGGAPIAPDLVQRIKRAFPAARVGNGFGLSETSSISTFLPHEYADAHADSVGFPAPVVDLRLADPDPETGVGELLIRGANVVQGYWGKPEATAEAFEDGWLRTGDLARIDEDGFTYVVDRAKDMINRGGENVYCRSEEHTSELQSRQYLVCRL